MHNIFREVENWYFGVTLMRYIAQITSTIPNIQIKIPRSWLLAWQKINQEDSGLL